MTLSTVELVSTVTQRGGVWRHMLDLATGLLDRDIGVVMTLPSSATQLVDEAGRIGCGPPGPTPPQIFHLHLADTFDRSAGRLLDAARRRGQTTVVTDHLPRSDASDPTIAARPPRPGATRFKTFQKRRQLARADAVVAVSRASAEFVEERYGPLRTTVHAVANGVRPERGPATDHRARTGPARYVAMGSIIEQKGFDRLVAAARVARRPWRVDVLGQGPHLETLREQSRSIVLDDGSPRVRFHGWQDSTEGFVRRADAFVLSSRWESAPYVVLEAMNAGLAVVSTKVDGPSEQVVDGETGILVEGDGRSIAAALDWGVDHSDELGSLGAAGRDRVARCFDVDSSVEETAEVYRSTTRVRSER